VSGFLDVLDASPQADGRWLINKPLRWQNGKTHTVPALFLTDWASIPVFLPTLVAALLTAWLSDRYDLGTYPAALIAGFVSSWLGLSSVGEHMWGAAVHDWLYWDQSVSRAEADKAFFDGMIDRGVLLIRAWSFYLAVRLFGWWAWETNKRLKAAGVKRVLDRQPDHLTRLPPRGLRKVLLIAAGERAA
jgi:hypothetical protein